MPANGLFQMEKATKLTTAQRKIYRGMVNEGFGFNHARNDDLVPETHLNWKELTKKDGFNALIVLLFKNNLTTRNKFILKFRSNSIKKVLSV